MAAVIDWPEAVREKVREASHTILCCWNDWDEIAGQDEQSAQNPDAYFDAMYAQLDTVLLGLLDEVFSERKHT
jgi:hypothetical protein